MDLETSVASFFTKYHLPTRGEYLLACSGGVDSMVLFHVLLGLRIPFSVAHCNFNLRGIESDEDEAFVKATCAEHNVTCFTKGFDTMAEVAHSGESVQMVARNLRYSWFYELMSTEQMEYVLTAHHLNDSFETFLINVVRGTGIKGLLGIPAKGEKVVRPLNRIPRAAILAFAKTRNIVWREDASNKSEKYQRNAIRHSVLPKLLGSTTEGEKGFEKTIAHLKGLSDFAHDQALQLFTKNVVEKNRCKVIPLSLFIGNTFLLHYYLQPYGNFDLAAIERSFKNPDGQYFDSATHELLIEKTGLWLREKNQLPEAKEISENTTHCTFGTTEIAFGVKSNTKNLDLRNPTFGFFDFDKVSFPLTLRGCKAGDVFSPYGLKGTKKLSDFFNDLGLNRFQREHTPLLLCGDEIIWVAGYRISEHYKIDSLSKSAYFAQLLN